MNTPILHRRAEKAFRGLPETEQSRVMKALEEMNHSDWRELLQNPKVHMLQGSREQFYVYRPSSRIRMIFTKQDDKTVQIVDIASHDVLRRYFSWEDKWKDFSSFSFNVETCQSELDDLEALLRSNKELAEKRDILLFFKKRKHLSAFIASNFPSMTQYDLLAYEFDVFGDFVADLVVGDSRSKTFLFIEFEEGKPNSIFAKQRTRSAPVWARPVERGISQVIDWFWKLDDEKQTKAFESRFGSRTITCYGLVVVGRTEGMSDTEKTRLEWRKSVVLCDSKHIEVTTFDDLAEDLEFRLQNYRQVP